MTTDERRRAGLIGALTMHGLGLTNTGPARRAFAERFERQADPEGRLTPEERQRRGEMLRRAYMLRLAAKSAGARAAKSRTAAA